MPISEAHLKGIFFLNFAFIFSIKTQALVKQINKSWNFYYADQNVTESN